RLTQMSERAWFSDDSDFETKIGTITGRVCCSREKKIGFNSREHRKWINVFQRRSLVYKLNFSQYIDTRKSIHFPSVTRSFLNAEQDVALEFHIT
ncbi:hypothetical protein L9F63_012388, partial [Diploptera punctata]